MIIKNRVEIIAHENFRGREMAAEIIAAGLAASLLFLFWNLVFEL
jgi:hypothetical protein